MDYIGYRNNDVIEIQSYSFFESPFDALNILTEPLTSYFYILFIKHSYGSTSKEIILGMAIFRHIRTNS